MRRTIFIATVVLTATLLAISMHLGAQSASEAPAGFDGQTNGTASQPPWIRPPPFLPR